MTNFDSILKVAFAKRVSAHNPFVVVSKNYGKRLPPIMVWDEDGGWTPRLPPDSIVPCPCELTKMPKPDPERLRWCSLTRVLREHSGVVERLGYEIAKLEQVLECTS